MAERDGRGRLIVRPRPRRILGAINMAATAQPVDLPRVRKHYPTMWAAMGERGYQTLAVEFARQTGSYFNGSQPGTGKTIETLATLAELDKRGDILVVATKKAIQSTWPREIGKWLAPDAATSVLVCDVEQGSREERDVILGEFAKDSGGPDFRFVLIHPEMLRWEFICDYVKPETGKKCNGQTRSCPQRKQHRKAPMYPNLFKIRWDAVIMDETHRFMMHANERAGQKSGWGYGAQQLKTAPDCIKIGMSGTPFKGKPRRFWPTLHWLDPVRWSSQHRWERTYFETTEDFFSHSGEKITDTMRKDMMEDFNAEIASVMIRHTKSELRKLNPAWAPPEKIHIDIQLPMDSKQARAYKSMLKEGTAQLLRGTLDANGLLAERTRLRQLACSWGRMNGERFAPTLPSNKWEWIVDALEERGLVGKRGVAPAINDGNVKVVIASQYTSLLELFATELDKMGIEHFIITGDSRCVSQIEDEWQSDQTHTRVLLLGKQAGGVSLTLDAADDLIHVEPSDNPDDDEQVEDRVHRTSRTDHQVSIYHLISDDSIEVSVASGSLQLDVTQKAILDGRRGVEFARLTLEGGKA